jgi:acetylornithine/succinyldiaminopimelate/putrescine aminotransferase
LELKKGLKVDGNKLSKILMKNGILSKATHDYCMRFTPALVIKEEEVLEAGELIEKSVRELEQINADYVKH